jgi:Ca2+-binding RTX toxin-like protein
MDLFKLDLTEYTPTDKAMVNGKFTLEVDLENGIAKALGVDHTPDTLLSIENIEILGSYDTRLTGTAEDNNIKCAYGKDVIDGGAGSDTLTGNDGADVFLVRLLDSGSDTILDFSTGDKLGLVDGLEPGDISTQVVDGNTQVLSDDQLLVTLDSYTLPLTEDVDYVSYSL